MLPFLFGQDGKDKFQISKVDNGYVLNFIDVVPPAKADAEEDEEDDEESGLPWEKGEMDGLAKLVKMAGAIKNAAGSVQPKTLVFLNKAELLKFLGEKL